LYFQDIVSHVCADSLYFRTRKWYVGLAPISTMVGDEVVHHFLGGTGANIF
jgi:hypothetical protein